MCDILDVYAVNSVVAMYTELNSVFLLEIDGLRPPHSVIFQQFPPFFHISVHFLYINTFNCVLYVDGGGASSGDKVIVVVVFVMVVVVVAVVVVVVVVFVVVLGY